MDKLISMTDFVLDQFQNRWSVDVEQVVNYAKLLKQPLTLGMFVPAKLVNGVWDVFEEPKQRNDKFYYTDENGEKWFKGELFRQYLKEYQEAKERVLFEGFEVYKDKSGLIKVFNSESNIELYLPNNNKVERLAFGKIVLTESAKQKIGL